MNEERSHVAVPKGRICLHCEKVIESKDAGFLLSNHGESYVVFQAIHRDCLFARIGMPA